MAQKVIAEIAITGPKDGHEGFGMAYLEAMAFALPGVGSSDGAVKSLSSRAETVFNQT